MRAASYTLPEELGPATVFLASAASSFMIGSIIVIDGGYTLFALGLSRGTAVGRWVGSDAQVPWPSLNPIAESNQKREGRDGQVDLHRTHVA
jgi:hypothetical protein